MKLTAEKKKRIIDLSVKYLNALDPSGVNAKKYKDFFESMSLSKMDEFLKTYEKEEEEYLPVDFCEFDRELKYENIEKAAKVLNIPLFETVFQPWISNDETMIVATPEPVPVGYLHVKRPQQTVAKKNGISTSVDKRSALTKQVSGGDKNGRNSDMENISMVALGLDHTLKELNSFRADDLTMFQSAIQEIYMNGTLSLKDLPDDVQNKATLNTVNEYLLCMGIKTDLVDKGLMFRKNIEQKINMDTLK